MCATKVDDEGFLVQWAYCGPDCPNGFTFTTDDTLKVSHHRLDKKEIMIAVKLLGIIVFSLTIIGLMVTGLGLYKLCLKYEKQLSFLSVMIIFDTLKCFESDDGLKIDWTLMRKFLKILSISLTIFTIIFFTCFGCFLVLNDSTSWAAQTVTLSSEGGANETYPDSMGEYQLAGEIGGYSWYRHKDREDRFLMYNNLGKI